MKPNWFVLFYFLTRSVYIVVAAEQSKNDKADGESMQNDPAAPPGVEKDDSKEYVVDTKFGGGGFLPEFNRKMTHYYSKGSKLTDKTKPTGKHCNLLTNPVNSNTYCTNLNLCQVICLEGFALPGGDTNATFVCMNGEWINKKTNSTKVDDCGVLCNPPCSSNGKCVAPNVCQCTGNFYGPYCQYENTPCTGYPPTPIGSSKTCKAFKSCIITCLNGRKFPDGLSQVNVNCKGGKWVYAGTNWTEPPNCLAVCNPVCQNGGRCVDNDVCLCPNNFRGPRCQYSIDECDVSKLNFNGAYNCTGNAQAMSCELSCPPGMTTDRELAPLYTCMYSEGVFKPPYIPQCQQIHHDVTVIRITDYTAQPHLEFTTPVIAKPSPATCLMWGGFNYKTFNGNIFNFKSSCTFQLVSDEVNHLFHVHVILGNGTVQKLVIYIENEKYEIYKNDKGLPSLLLEKSKEVLSIPSQLPDLKVEIASGKSVIIYLPISNVYIFWNLQDMVRVDIDENLWNKTEGLCSRSGDIVNSGDKYYNLEKYISKLLVPSDKCIRPFEEISSCTREEFAKADKICQTLKTNIIFSDCQDVLPMDKHVEACRQTYCNTPEPDRTEAICKFLSMFVKTCSIQLPQITIKWRKEYKCLVQCQESQVYTACMPVSQATCVSNEVKPNALEKFCEEGCVCPAGTALHEDKCVKKESCPCIFRSQFYPHSHIIQKDCNQCTCMGGKWSCTDAVCKGVCFVIGDSHYKTFDGKKYNFLGKCSYNLVITSNVTVESDNSACSAVFLGSGSSYDSMSKPPCSKSVIIHVNGKTVIKLKPSHGISVDNVEVEKLPYSRENEFYIRKSSTYLVQVSLHNGLEVFWDGMKKLIIRAAASLQDKTKGLCGTFNRNQKDDLLTPEGDVEQDIYSFAVKYKAKEVCDKPDIYPSDPCEVNIQNKASASQYCSNLTGSLFADCHAEVDPKSYYEECMYDMCSCKSNKIASCLCPIVSSYAEECTRQGIAIDWRSSIRECGVHCSGGQRHELCGNSCQRSCADISRREVCKENCYEGCYCPLGYTFNDKEECIPISECPCFSNGHEYPAHYMKLYENGTTPEVCECKNAVWECRTTTKESVDKYKQIHSTKCLEFKNMEFSHCEPAEPITCKNMENPPQYTPAVCHAGCVCKEGYVLDSITKLCVKPDECPCHHGGNTYKDGDVMKEECNTCKCTKGKWECTQKNCPGVCSSWGDTHFHTFDGRFYDFQGTCDYMFSEGKLSETELFSIIVEIVPCGTGGTSCAKSVTLNVRTGGDSESVIFVKDKDLPDPQLYKKIFIYQAGLQVIAAVPSLYITLQWDKGTRIGIQVEPKWNKKLKGLCGNFDGDSSNDFQTPSGGLTEVSSLLFADSWKLQQHCPPPPTIQDPCELHPFRKVWAVEKCNLLKVSPVFKQCHSEVPIDEYINRCIFDSCACDQGGDCECVCTVFAAYGAECAARGLPIKWRKLDNCPIQCDSGTEYSANITACPDKTCDNLLDYERDYSLCHQLPCVEGCVKKQCPPGQIYRNSSSTECISINNCVCMNVNGIVYYENDVIEEDACHKCTCSKGQKLCTGVPCVPTTISTTAITTPTTTSTTTSTSTEMTIAPTFGTSSTESEIYSEVLCTDGWTDWVTINEPLNGRADVANYLFITYNDKLEQQNYKSTEKPPICEAEMMDKIACRYKTAYDIYVDGNCSFSETIGCVKDCKEMQIKVLCNCAFPHIIDDVFREMPPVPGCVEHWTGWLDAANPQTGLYEPLTAERRSGLCPKKHHLEDIQCVYVKPVKSSKKKVHPSMAKLRPKKQTSSAIDWTLSDDVGVVCNKSVGLVCDKNQQPSGQCRSYKFRAHCICDEQSTTIKTTITPPTEPPLTTPFTTEEWTFDNSTPPASPCPEGSVWLDCKVKCDQLCLYYQKNLSKHELCPSRDACIPGCAALHYSHMPCPPGKYWRDENTCVADQDCTCVTHNGTMAKPGSLIHEDECNLCQCLNNGYSCTNICTPPPTPITTAPILYTTSTTPSTIAPTESTTLSIQTTSSTEEIMTPTTPEIVTMHTTIIVPPVKTTPPPQCEANRYTTMNVSHYKVSSSADDDNNGPTSAQLQIVDYSVINSKPWRAKVSNEEQYLELDLDASKPVYGLTLYGNSASDEYVKSFKILYSTDGVAYSYMLQADQTPIVFDGLHNSDSPVTRIFKTPIESRYVRIVPVLWHNWISLQVLVLGCSPSSAPAPPILMACMEPMGLESGRVSLNQVKVSSSLSEDYGAKSAALNSSSAWIPSIATNAQYIQFDFLNEHVLTGITTKGIKDFGTIGDAWVEQYTVEYSHDGLNWNLVMNDKKEVQIFPGNSDGVSAQTNFFSTPLNARYLKVTLVKWFNNKSPALKIEVLGCYVPQPPTIAVVTESTPPETPSTLPMVYGAPVKPTTTEKTEKPEKPCDVCKGVPPTSSCDCPEGKLWDGDKCTLLATCPCIIGHMKYAVGESYLNENCEKCICSIGGTPVCKLLECPPCAEGEIRSLTKSCSCVCAPCPEGTRLCPTSNICINETLWCNGFKDCQDDETDCTTTTSSTVAPTPFITTVPTSPPPPPCPEPKCPPGYKPVFVKSSTKGKTSKTSKTSSSAKVTDVGSSSPGKIPADSYTAMLLSQALAHSGSTKGKTTVKTHGYKQKKGGTELTISEYVKKQEEQKQTQPLLECASWRCETEHKNCSTPTCPPASQLKTVWTGEMCPSYECIAPPATEKVCEVDGKHFKTFDGSSFKADVCDHILAEDKYYATWKIRKVFKCPYVGNCAPSLIIEHTVDVIQLFSNFSTTYNGYPYTVVQLQNIGNRTGSFVIRTISSSFIIFTSTQLDFSVIWSSSGNVKVIVDSSLYGMVYGLCGFFDNNPANDKMKPSGELTDNTQDFVNSWKEDSSTVCEAKICPIEIQTKAAAMCNAIKEPPLDVCGFTQQLDEQVAKCIEAICLCSETTSDISKCRCDTLQRFVTTCSLAQQGVDLSLWRMKSDCAVNCTPPFVYQDCYNRQCEPSCHSLLHKDECARIPDVCYPGCYCPEGLLKETTSCIKPPSCRDCQCEGNGVTRYTTFDQLDVPLDEPCASYVLVRTNKLFNKLKSGFSITLTNGPCSNAVLGKVCQHGLTIKAHDQEILLMQSNDTNGAIIASIDKQTISNFPYNKEGIVITESPGTSATLSIRSLELDVTFNTQNRGFSIKLPSYIYSDKTEGLCGVCNGKPEDDIMNEDGTIPKSAEEFISGWQTHDTADFIMEDCEAENKTACVPPQTEDDICLFLEKKEAFEPCHALVNVDKYVQQCHDFMCNGQEGSYCHAFEAYAKECQKFGVCLKWRTRDLCPYTCPKDFVYKACSLSCDITCDNYQTINEDKSICPGPLTEKCVCPEGQVISNGTCVLENRCYPCDKYGHYVDDKWKKDNCTMCICLEEGDIQCQKKQCPAQPTCSRNYELTVNKDNDDQCCVKYDCVYTAPNCTEVSKPTCGKDQILKVELTAENCTTYFCSCIPREQCPDPELMKHEKLLPGMVKVEVKEGCCPYYAIECHNETCPAPPKCPQYYILSESKNHGECCFKYECEIPKDKCLYKYEWIASQNGGERRRSDLEMYTELKEIGDTWSDGPCRQCICQDEVPRATCTALKCPDVNDSPDFVSKPVYHYDTCCPSYKHSACKVGDTVYEVGSIWPVPGHPCLNKSCSGNVETGVLILQEIVHSCDTICKPGSKYIPAEDPKKQCCGSCKQVSCIDDHGNLYAANSTWKSEDNCTSYECDENLQIITSIQTCPDVSTCPPKDIYQNGCCKACRLHPHDLVTCNAEPIPISETNKMIRKDVSGHNECYNKPSTGFTRCRGLCDTFEWYNDETTRYGGVCKCCEGTTFQKKKVEMECADKYAYYHTVEVPTECGCQECGGNIATKNSRFTLSSLPYMFGTSALPPLKNASYTT